MFTCMYQFCLLAFTKFISLRRLGFTRPLEHYFSIQDWVRIHEGTGGCHLPCGWKNVITLLKLFRAVTESNLLVVLTYYPYGKYAPLCTLRRKHVLELECSDVDNFKVTR